MTLSIRRAKKNQSAWAIVRIVRRVRRCLMARRAWNVASAVLDAAYRTAKRKGCKAVCVIKVSVEYQISILRFEYHDRYVDLH